MLTEVLDSIGILGRDMRPAAQYLSFAWPKERHQRKGHPNCLRPVATASGNLRCALWTGSG